MKSLKKCAALLTSAVMAASLVSCGSIKSALTFDGAGDTTYGVTIDGYKVRAGVFIFYTISSYYEATQLISEKGDNSKDVDNVKNAIIDNTTSKKWIQNKATEYCGDFVAVQKEFDSIGAKLTDDEETQIKDSLSYYMESNNKFYEKNGIGEDSLKDIITFEYKRQHVFDYYYGFKSEKGKTEDELKDYYDDNYARVKYVTISLKDSNGSVLKGDDKKKLVNMAYDYADRVNDCSTETEKLKEMNEVKKDYDDYVADQTAKAAAASGSTTTTTTTTTVSTSKGETTTTTTTDPHANEEIIKKATEATTTATDKSNIIVSQATTTTAVTTTSDTATFLPSKNSNKYIFEKAKLGEASVYEESDAVYVIYRADLRERMTKEDLWTDDEIKSLQSELYNSDFTDFIDSIVSKYDIQRNEHAYKRYDPFKLDLKQESSTAN